MSATHFYGRDGRRCQATEWQRLRNIPAYVNVRQYDNGAIRVVVEWTGKQENADDIFTDCHALFTLHASNYGAQGMLRQDPNQNGRTFPTEALAVKAYDDFLYEWTDCHSDEDGKLVEVDNELEPEKPPPPPDPDAPTSDVSKIKLGATMDDSVW